MNFKNIENLEDTKQNKDRNSWQKETLEIIIKTITKIKIIKITIIVIIIYKKKLRTISIEKQRTSIMMQISFFSKRISSLYLWKTNENGE